MTEGYLSIVLHAHLPYVRHPEYDEFLEEDWLFEAITETYIPLLRVFNRLADEGRLGRASERPRGRPGIPRKSCDLGSPGDEPRLE